MLASVTTAAEARVCLAAGADIVDAKDPLSGSLGALPVEIVREIAAVAAAGGRPVSATIGDLACEPELIGLAVTEMAATGVDYVKIGFLPGSETRIVIADLGRSDFRPSRLVGVLFADLDPDFALIGALAEAGFAGVLIDTSDKSAGPLPGLMEPVGLAEFIALAHRAGLFAGLAGSLRIDDIDALCRLRPDILGFRGALCLDSRRTFAIDETSVQRIRARLDVACGTTARAAG
ncbi:MAG: (5-formylfuran-3-yl)methyl phosphate synthase [Alphaproteobacteria bacterium]|nr:(5-formylfuran-3-yl)methyl phosphate synthase [Alphaproteobacteria bacterium]